MLLHLILQSEALANLKQDKSSLPPVVLLHGLFRTDYKMTRLEKRIKASFPGRKVYNFNVLLGGGSTIFNDIDYYCEEFAKLVKNTDATTVDIVGHSLGAHVARTYVELYAGTEDYPKVRHLISVAGVNSGFYCKRWCYALAPGILTQKVLGNGFIKNNIIPANLYVSPYVENPVGQLAELREKKKLDVDLYVCFFSAKDKILRPDESGGYEFYDKNGKLEDFLHSPDYVNNNFGIKDLFDSGKMKVIRLDQYSHGQFLWSKIDSFYPLMEPFLE